MSRPKLSTQSPIPAALADVAAGMSQSDAASKYGVLRSSISRAIKLRDAPKCPCCGRKMQKARALG